MVDKQKIKGMVYNKINVFKEQKFEPGNRRWEFYMTLLYMICMLALALGFFISSLLTVIQSSKTVDVSNYSYNQIVTLLEDTTYDSVTCPCSDTQIEYGAVSKMDWVPFAFCRPDVDLVNTYNDCKKIKTCRTADPFRFQLLAFFAYLCPVADTFAKSEVSIFNSRTVSSTNMMTKKAFVDELTFYENVVEQNVKNQLYTPVEIARALSYVNRPLNPNFVTERSSDSALIYDTTYTSDACFCKSDYLCTISKTLSYGTFTVGCSNLETYMSLKTSDAVPILKGILDTKYIDQNLSPDENTSSIEVSLTNGLVHKWRNDISASHPKYYRQCAPKSCKTVQSTKTPFNDALTAALAVLGGAATGVKIVVGLVYTALKKIYKIPEVDEVAPAGTTGGDTTDKDEVKQSPPFTTNTSREVQVAAVGVNTNSGGPYPT